MVGNKWTSDSFCICYVFVSLIPFWTISLFTRICNSVQEFLVIGYHKTHTEGISNINAYHHLYWAFQDLWCFKASSHNLYVYWTVHHLDSWVKRDQLDATCFIITLFSAQHVSDINTSILRSLRLIRRVTSWVVSGSMCVAVMLQCGTLQPNTNTHRTRYNPWSLYELVASSWGWMY